LHHDGDWCESIRPVSSAPFDGPYPDPAAVLPHRPPFLFLDAVTELVPGVSARGYWRLTGEEPFFGGHFPGRPTLPGVLMVESIAQLGAYAVLTAKANAKLALFGGVDRVRFRRQVVPGDTLDLEVELGRMSARAGKGQGRAILRGKTACEADLHFVLVDAVV
jgi:3-hydroxyacyl-[acyl-carrier-protein] dehydratase